jgi:GTP-binding protein Era
MAFRSGFVSIIGRPNSGKSTLLNSLVGEKIAIVTHKPQTTRSNIQGMVNLQAKKGRPGGQIIFVDTPGVHKPGNSLNRRMMDQVRMALGQCDLILLLIDVTQPFGAGDKFVLDMLKRYRSQIFLVLNKIDLIAKEALLPRIAKYAELRSFAEVLPVSALKKEGLDLLLERVISALPQGPRHFPQEQITDQSERALVAELVREKVLQHAGQEVPYASAVRIEEFETKPHLTRVAAAIYCERDGQKAILIGKGGQMLKKIGTAARFEIEKRLGTKVYLELFVKVRPGWRGSRDMVEGMPQ